MTIGILISTSSKIGLQPARILSYILITFLHSWVLSFNCYWIALKLGGLSLDRNSWYSCSLALSLLFAGYCQYYFVAKDKTIEDFETMEFLIGYFAPVLTVAITASYFLLGFPSSF